MQHAMQPGRILRSKNTMQNASQSRVHISRLSEVYSFPMGQTEIRESSIGGPADGYVVGRNLLVQPCLQGGEVLEKSVGAHLVGSGKLF